jgi:hypothetical protein
MAEHSNPAQRSPSRRTVTDDADPLPPRPSPVSELSRTSKRRAPLEDGRFCDTSTSISSLGVRVNVGRSAVLLNPLWDYGTVAVIQDARVLTRQQDGQGIGRAIISTPGSEAADLGESGLCGRNVSFSFRPREMGRRLSTLRVRTQQPPPLCSPESRDLSPSPYRGRSTGRTTITAEPEM